MEEKRLDIITLKAKYRIRSYQISKEFGIPDCTFSRMLNGHIEMPDKVYRKIKRYFEQFEDSKQQACTI